MMEPHRLIGSSDKKAQIDPGPAWLWYTVIVLIYASVVYHGFASPLRISQCLCQVVHRVGGRPVVASL